MQAALRSKWTNINWGRMCAVLLVIVLATLWLTEPAFAFDQFESRVTDQTKAATGVGQTILRWAAVLALLVGLAPMLWGQFKAKWVISCCVGAVLIFLVGEVITAFAGV